jgi:hypothetical protein
MRCDTSAQSLKDCPRHHFGTRGDEGGDHGPGHIRPPLVIRVHSLTPPGPTRCQLVLQAKIDRGYDDYVEGRISDALWARKSAEWETELATVTAELSAVDRPAIAFVATGERIIELVKRAGILYETQDSAEQRRILESVLSNCTFDRGSLCPTYKKPFDLFARATETCPSCLRDR